MLLSGKWYPLAGFKSMSFAETPQSTESFSPRLHRCGDSGGSNRNKGGKNINMFEDRLSRPGSRATKMVRGSQISSRRDHALVDSLPLRKMSFLSCRYTAACRSQFQVMLLGNSNTHSGSSLTTLWQRYSVRQQKLSPAMLLPDHSTAYAWRASSRDIPIPMATMSDLW
jgi:hypothetical protein